MSIQQATIEYMTPTNAWRVARSCDMDDTVINRMMENVSRQHPGARIRAKAPNGSVINVL